jgi:hypothetical protein
VTTKTAGTIAHSGGGGVKSFVIIGLVRILADGDPRDGVF